MSIKMNELMVVQDSDKEIIGSLLYYSISNVMVDKERFIDLGNSFNLPKVKPKRESKSGAFRSATTAIKDRIVSKESYGTNIFRVYCRDNKKELADKLSRELVKETLGFKSNKFEKFANIAFDKEFENMYYDNVIYDSDIDVRSYCERALNLYDRFQNCYNSDQINSVIDDLLYRMQAIKINIHGNLYFVPETHHLEIHLMEDFLESLNEIDLNGGNVVINSMFVANTEKQRVKMTNEFYESYKKDIEFYQERVQQFINSGCKSKAVINRWISKIEELQLKKRTYENILRKELSALDSDLSLLQMQSDELRIRSIDGQTIINHKAA